MVALTQDFVPETVVSSTALSPQVRALVEKGLLTKIARKLYIKTPKVKPADLPEAIQKAVQRNCWQIVAELLPNGLIADRTALENAPTQDGSICVVSTRQTNYKFPGLIIRPRPGHGPIAGEDQPFLNGLWLSCPGRAYLENLRPSRNRKSQRRTLPVREIETRLDGVLRSSGEAGLNKIRDQAKRVAPVLGLEKELQTLDGIIGTLMGTRTAKLYSDVGKARVFKRPYDPERNQPFLILWHYLTQTALPDLPKHSPEQDAVLPFYDAYFSNYIEGTKFKVEEAQAIVFENHIPLRRPQDAHDILGTYRIVVSPDEMAKVPTHFGQLLSLLRERHALMLAARPEIDPGAFKEKPNQAGSTVFVAPELVQGTLEKGFELYTTLQHPFAKAIFMHFLVSEVHPFSDGNGRLSRIMLNAELVAAGRQRLVIPSVYRTEYLQSLKAMSNNHKPEPMMKVLALAQRYTHEIDFSDLARAQHVLTLTNAFADPADALGEGKRLLLPSVCGLTRSSTL